MTATNSKKMAGGCDSWESLEIFDFNDALRYKSTHIGRPRSEASTGHALSHGGKCHATEPHAVEGRVSAHAGYDRCRGMVMAAFGEVRPSTKAEPTSWAKKRHPHRPSSPFLMPQSCRNGLDAGHQVGSRLIRQRHDCDVGVLRIPTRAADLRGLVPPQIHQPILHRHRRLRPGPPDGFPDRADRRTIPPSAARIPARLKTSGAWALNVSHQGKIFHGAYRGRPSTVAQAGPRAG